MKNRKEIGERLKKIREKKQISTHKLQKEYGLRYEILKSIEEGNASYTVNSLLKYCEGVGCYIEIKSKKD